MANTKNVNPAAFGEILAGLGAGADHPAGGRATPRGEAILRGGAKTAPTMDISWIQSARMRASAAQMAQRVATTAEPKQVGGFDRPQWTVENTIEDWRGATAHHPPQPTGPDPHEPDAQDASGPEPAVAAPEPEAPELKSRAPHVPAEPKSNPVHALWRILSQIPGGWRAGSGAVASVLAATRSSRRRAGAAKRAAPKPEPRSDGAQKSEDETIAEELGLRADLAIVDLRRIRRDFAKKNHPDRFEPAQRLGAARRMTIANMLIDAHMKQRPPSL